MYDVVIKPWGTYQVIKEKDSCYKVKHICVLPGKRLSLQSHQHRAEHWVIVKGNAWVQLGDLYHRLKENEHIYIPANEKHRIENCGDGVLEFIETQCGSYLGEDDIIRYDDDYGRV
jgi:mannose-6-phosphate isomerase-like protein (cupin superfamily)